jgi:hypothetical protein
MGVVHSGLRGTEQKKLPNERTSKRKARLEKRGTYTEKKPPKTKRRYDPVAKRNPHSKIVTLKKVTRNIYELRLHSGLFSTDHIFRFLKRLLISRGRGWYCDDSKLEFQIKK